jgi:hypothetical protein
VAVIRRVRVSSLYHQVEIRDAVPVRNGRPARSRSWPQRPALSWPPRSDLDGEVEIEVRVGAGLDDPTAGQLLFDGELFTTGQSILVGNSLTDLHYVGLPIG